MKSVAIVFTLSILAVCGLVTNAAAVATIWTVQQTGLTFVPNDIAAEVGDTVVWVHTTGSHTVTNGTGAADQAAGTLFDFPLVSGTVSYELTASGDIPFFCRPHESLGMTGLIRVSDSVATEARSFGSVKQLYR